MFQTREYEEFEPPSNWVHEDACDKLTLMLPGFKKELLKVQVTSRTQVLRVSGFIQMNEKKWRRFHKEFSIPPQCDTSKINAKFEAGILYIKLPKLINQQNIAPIPTPTPQEPQKPQQPATIPQKPNIVPQVSDQKKQVVQQEPKKEIEEVSQKKEKGKAEELKDDIDDVASKVVEKMALCGLVDGVKKQKKFVNLLVLVFLVLLFGLYVKNVISSIFSGGHKNQEL